MYQLDFQKGCLNLAVIPKATAQIKYCPWPKSQALVFSIDVMTNPNATELFSEGWIGKHG